MVSQIFGFRVTGVGWQLFGSAALVVIPHCSAAFIEESLYKWEHFRFGWFQVMFLFFCCCIFAIIDSNLFEETAGIVGPLLPLHNSPGSSNSLTALEAQSSMISSFSSPNLNLTFLNSQLASPLPASSSTTSSSGLSSSTLSSSSSSIPPSSLSQSFITWLSSLFGGSDNIRLMAPKYLILSVLTLLTSGFTKASLNLVNYPTQVIFKSCKLVPVMILARLLSMGGRKAPAGFSNPNNSLASPHREEFIAAGLLSAGMILFSFGDYITATAPSSSAQGICYLIIALVLPFPASSFPFLSSPHASRQIAEGFLANYQQALIQERKSETEMMTFNNLFAGILAFFACIIMGELVEALSFCARNPFIVFNLFFYSVLLYIGNVMISLSSGSTTAKFIHTSTGIKALLSIVHHYGIIAAVMIANFRKLITMSLSFFFFPKQVSINHLLGAALVVTGVFISSHLKVRQQSERKSAMDLRKATLYEV